ncbi:MAG: hypothetical protein MUO23_14190 [Anaerolineales bacterium]|nr:hypothetical protein [Anaerolineales bacterium]
MKPVYLVLLLLGVMGGPAASHGSLVIEGSQPSRQSNASPNLQATATSPGGLLLPLSPTSTPPQETHTLVPDSGCCTSVFWSPDSLWVAYVAKPEGPRAAGIYGAAADGTGVRRLFSRVGLLSPDWALMAYPEEEKTILMSTASGRKWVVPAAGRAVRFSPSGGKIIWEIGSSTYAQLDLRRRAIWMADVDGSDALRVVSTYGGGFVGWTAGETILLVSGKLSAYDPRGVWSVPLNATPPWLLFEADRVRDPLLSPDGTWLAFYVAYDTDPARDGLWLVKTDGTQQHQLPVFGAYHWRSGDQLLVVPQDLSSETMQVVQVDAPSGAVAKLPLAGPALAISANDWQPSPDGRWLAYVSGDTGGLMLAPLP